MLLAAGSYLIDRSSSAVSALFTIKLNEKYFNPCPWCQQIKLIIFSVMFPFGPPTLKRNLGLVLVSFLRDIPQTYRHRVLSSPETLPVCVREPGPPNSQRPFHSQPHRARLHLTALQEPEEPGCCRLGATFFPECLPFSL